MERVQRLLGALSQLSAQPSPLAQQAASSEPGGLTDLLGAVRQLRAFMDLPDSEAFSPLGEAILSAASALAEQVLGALDVPDLVGNSVQQFVRETRSIISELRILGSKRRSN